MCLILRMVGGFLWLPGEVTAPSSAAQKRQLLPEELGLGLTPLMLRWGLVWGFQLPCQGDVNAAYSRAEAGAERAPSLTMAGTKEGDQSVTLTGDARFVPRPPAASRRPYREASPGKERSPPAAVPNPLANKPRHPPRRCPRTPLRTEAAKRLRSRTPARISLLSAPLPAPTASAPGARRGRPTRGAPRSSHARTGALRDEASPGGCLPAAETTVTVGSPPLVPPACGRGRGMERGLP